MGVASRVGFADSAFYNQSVGSHRSPPAPKLHLDLSVAGAELELKSLSLPCAGAGLRRVHSTGSSRFGARRAGFHRRFCFQHGPVRLRGRHAQIARSNRRSSAASQVFSPPVATNVELDARGFIGSEGDCAARQARPSPDANRRTQEDRYHANTRPAHSRVRNGGSPDQVKRQKLKGKNERVQQRTFSFLPFPFTL